MLHFWHLNYVVLSLCLAETAWHQILLNCISQCLLSLVSSLLVGLWMKLAVKMLSGEGSLLTWGGSVFCNQLGPPVKLWTAGTIGQQFALTVSLSLSRNVVFQLMCVRVWFSTSSVMSQSVRLLLVAILLNVLQHNSACNKPNTWLWTWCKHMHCLACRMFWLWKESTELLSWR
jgi:hypothetical protein